VAVPEVAASAEPGTATAVRAAPVEVASIASPPISEIVTQMLQESDHHTAELVLKELGVRTTGRGTTADGLAAERTVLAGLGVPAEAVRAVDGSGLDRGDRLTCNALLTVLRRQPVDGPLLSGLAVAGENGTLRDRFRASPAKGRLRGKTGTLDGVSGLVGTVATLSGGRVDFALLLNNLANNGYGLEAGEELAAVLVRYPDTPPLTDLGP
jgi:D-alanyl-D-alanine carboxypeptidase/D-alanyl-D-alanine-endopeptidase (penicillin-binding protein 4)